MIRHPIPLGLSHVLTYVHHDPVCMHWLGCAAMNVRGSYSFVVVVALNGREPWRETDWVFA